MKLTQIIMTMAALTGTAFGSDVNLRRNTKHKAFFHHYIKHLQTGDCMDVDVAGRVILVNCGTAPDWVVEWGQNIKLAQFGHPFQGQCLSLDSNNDAIVENCINTRKQTWYAERVFDELNQYRIRNPHREKYLQDTNEVPVNYVEGKDDDPNLADQRWELPEIFW